MNISVELFAVRPGESIPFAQWSFKSLGAGLALPFALTNSGRFLLRRTVHWELSNPCSVRSMVACESSMLRIGGRGVEPLFRNLNSRNSPLGRLLLFG